MFINTHVCRRTEAAEVRHCRTVLPEAKRTPTGAEDQSSPIILCLDVLIDKILGKMESKITNINT